MRRFLVVLLLAVCVTAQAAPAWESGDGFRRLRLDVPASGRAGFTLLAPETTGIRFDNPLPPLLAAANNTLMNGPGVAAGDFDGDGWCDLYFCAIAGTNALLRNRGDGTFEDVTARAGLASDAGSTSLATADVDGDGDLDLYVATYGAPDIYVCNDFQTVDRVWINDGRGSFRPLPRLALRKQSFSSMGVDFADLDRDGALDFMVTEMMSREHRLRMRQVVGMAPLVSVPGRITNRPEVPRNTLYFGRGDGTWAELAHYAGVPATDWSWPPLFLDIDLDGYEDLLIGNGILFNVQDRDVLERVRTLGRQSPEQSRTNLLLYPPFRSRNLAFRNRGDRTFSDVSDAWSFGPRRITQGLALGLEAGHDLARVRAQLDQAGHGHEVRRRAV